MIAQPDKKEMTLNDIKGQYQTTDEEFLEIIQVLEQDRALKNIVLRLVRHVSNLQ